MQNRVREARPGGDLASVVELAKSAGFEFTSDELRVVFAKDWQMRRRFYGAIKETTPSP